MYYRLDYFSNYQSSYIVINLLEVNNVCYLNVLFEQMIITLRLCFRSLQYLGNGFVFTFHLMKYRMSLETTTYPSVQVWGWTSKNLGSVIYKWPHERRKRLVIQKKEWNNHKNSWGEENTVALMHIKRYSTYKWLLSYFSEWISKKNARSPFKKNEERKAMESSQSRKYKQPWSTRKHFWIHS